MKSVETVMIYLQLRAGAWNEKNGFGALHLIEHLSFDGTDTLATQLEMEIFKEGHGINNGGSTSGSYVEYWASCPSPSLMPSADLLRGEAFFPQMNEKDIVKEKRVISQEYTDRWSNPHQRYWQSCVNQLFGKKHVYARNAIGEMDFVNSLTRAELVKLHKTHFVSSNCIVGIAGKITRNQAQEAVEHLFDKVPKGKKTQLKYAPIVPENRYLFHKEDENKTVVELNFITPGRDDFSQKQRIAFFLSKYILGGSMRSLLARELRVKSGLVYDCGSTVSYRPTAGVYSLDASTNLKDAKEVFSIMKKVFVNFLHDGVPDQEFQRALNYINMRTLMVYDSVSGIADNITSSLFLDNKIVSVEELNEIANSITQDYMLKLLRKYLDMKKAYISIMAREDPKLSI